MKHQNVIDKTRSYNKNKAYKSKSLYTQNQHQVHAAASESLPAVETPAVVPEELSFMEKAKDGIQKFASDVSKSVSKKVTKKNLKSAGGIASAVAIASAVVVVAGRQLAKNGGAKKVGRKFAKDIMAAEGKAVREVKKQVKSVKKFLASPTTKKAKSNLKSAKSKVSSVKRNATRKIKTKAKSARA